MGLVRYYSTRDILLDLSPGALLSILHHPTTKHSPPPSSTRKVLTHDPAPSTPDNGVSVLQMMPLTAQQHKSDGTSSQEGKKKKKIYIYIYTYINEFKFPSGATLSGHYKPAEVGRLLLGMPGAVVPPPPFPHTPRGSCRS